MFTHNRLSSKSNSFGRSIIRFIITISFLINFALFIILFTPLNEWLYSFIKVSEIPQKGDVIVVLSCPFYYDTEKGVPDMSTLMRLEKGLELYKEGYADKIIVLGGIVMKRSNKTIAQAMKERLLLYNVPREDIIVHDDIKGTWEYYDNLLLLLEKYKDQFDFTKALFVTSSEQAYRIKKCLNKKLHNPIVITSEPYEFAPDWGQRFHLFRRVVNEIFFAIPSFYFSNRL